MKAVKLDPNITPESRPTLGRPKKPTPIIESASTTGPPSNKPFTKYSSSNPHPDYIKKGPLFTQEMFDKWTPDLLGIPDINTIDLSQPPPNFKTWSASAQELATINASIRGV